MQLLNLTLDLPAKNIALDEALLEQAELVDNHPEVLRLWQPQQNQVVVGRSTPLAHEVNLEYCHEHQVPVFRRCSGGAAIVTGPGCLMYAVLLDYRKREHLRMLEQAHRFVIGQMQAAMAALGVEVQMQGTSDLTLDGRKFSGNSLRCKRNWMLYHGTLLCDFPLPLIARCLRSPIRQPKYRQGRSHSDFLTNLPLPMESLQSAIAEQWSAQEPIQDWPRSLTAQLAVEKYSTDEWTNKVM